LHTAGISLAQSVPGAKERYFLSALYNTCRVGACSGSIPAPLARRGVCLAHYLDEAFTRATRAMRDCQTGQATEPRLVEWLLAQGDCAVQLLADGSNSYSGETRDRLLELIVCLNNIQEYVRHHYVARTSQESC
jgi:hypothetical protein